MSFFKFWNSSSSSKKGSTSSKQQTPSKEKENQPTSSQNNTDDPVFEDEEGNIPFKSGGRRDGRNLSISRSGRHKFRGRQRSTVITGELYGAQNGESGAGASGATGSDSRAPPHCRDSTGSRGVSGGMSSSSQPTAV